MQSQVNKCQLQDLEFEQPVTQDSDRIGYWTNGTQVGAPGP